MSRVAGLCPVGCGQSLILVPDTRAWCGSRTCSKPEATSLLLADQADLGLAQGFAVCVEDEGQLHQISTGTYLTAEAARSDEQAVLSIVVIGTWWRTSWVIGTGFASAT